jgi:hypothetical protein
VRKACALLIVSLTMGIAPAFAQSTIPAPELVERLERAELLAKQGLSDPSAERMTRLRRTLRLPVLVQLDGWTVSLGPDSVLEELDGGVAGDFDRALARVRALRGVAQRAIGARPADPDNVEAALNAAYRDALQVRPGLVERIQRAVSELRQGLAYRLFTFVGTSSVLAWMVLVGFALLGYGLVRRLRLIPERTLTAPTKGSTGGSPVDWSRRAEEAIRTGDLKEAVRALYRALLATLARRGLLVDAPGLTAGECRKAVEAARPSLLAAVTQATHSFERVAYGGLPPESSDVDLLRRADALAGSA